jgi:P27 family predicted phage terminase small subunit
MGRTARPAKLKLIEGRSPGRDSGGRKVPVTPRFRREAPEPPSDLDDEARAEWERIVPGLDELGLLTPTHRAALAAYCDCWSTYCRAVRQVRAEGLTVVSPRSRVVHRNPAVGIAAEARTQLLAFCARFGLTPADELKFGTPADDGGGGYNPFA